MMLSSIICKQGNDAQSWGLYHRNCHQRITMMISIIDYFINLRSLEDGNALLGRD